MSKNIAKDEIDLLDTTIIIWKKKIIVIIFMVLSTIIAFISQSTQEDGKFKISTEVRPITVIDEAKYKIYNSIINTIKPYYVRENIIDTVKEENELQSKSFKIIETNMKNLKINNIDKKFLLDLFIDRLKQKSNIIRLIKKFELIKKDDYPSILEYENAVIEIGSSIKLQNINKKAYEQEIPVIIQFETLNINNLENFLVFIEKETNEIIQEDLSLMFENYINYVKAIKQFRIEDIQTQLSVTSDDIEKIALMKKRDILIANKYVDRMENIFNSSPISDKENFYAAKIIIDSTKYEKTGNKSKIRIYLVATIFGALLGIFFALISNAIQNRK